MQADGAGYLLNCDQVFMLAGVVIHNPMHRYGTVMGEPSPIMWFPPKGTQKPRSSPPVFRGFFFCPDDEKRRGLSNEPDVQMTTTETNRYRGFDIVPRREWSQWCVSIYPTRSDLPIMSRSTLRSLTQRKSDSLADARKRIDRILTH